jgi:hypothetical protein
MLWNRKVVQTDSKLVSSMKRLEIGSKQRNTEPYFHTADKQATFPKGKKEANKVVPPMKTYTLLN